MNAPTACFSSGRISTTLALASFRLVISKIVLLSWVWLSIRRVAARSYVSRAVSRFARVSVTTRLDVSTARVCESSQSSPDDAAQA